MSQVYATEPSTTGRVVFQTSHGTIDINLWCKECPSTTRAFLQLCLDGYYDGIIFHRILNDFLIQCGLTTTDNTNNKNNNNTGSLSGSKKVQDSASMKQYLSKYVGMETVLNRKKLELSPRIRFNHRGQIALALPIDFENSSNNNDNDDHMTMMDDDPDSIDILPQFFITLDEAPFLNNKHVIFGTINGPTIFNAIRIGKTDTTTHDDAPSDLEHAPVIQSVKIDFHPFSDLIATNESMIPWKNIDSNATTTDAAEVLKKRKKQRKGKKDLNVLSFGNEMEDVDDGLETHNQTMMSIYDDGEPAETKNPRKTAAKSEGKSKSSVIQSSEDSKNIKNNKYKIKDEQENIDDNDSMIRSQVQSQQQHNNNNIQEHNYRNNNITTNESHHMRSNSKFSTSSMTEMTTQAKPKISAVEARRMKYLSKSQQQNNNKPIKSKEREDETMSKLMSFRTKMFSLKSSSTSTGGAIKSSALETLGESRDSTTQQGGNTIDNDLATRMAKRLHKESETISQRNAAPTYSGQILEEDLYNDDTTTNIGNETIGENLQNDKSSWLKTTFKCKRHLDHESKGMGGDGRDMNDYVVIDDTELEGGRMSRHVSKKKHHNDRHRDRNGDHTSTSKKRHRDD